MVVELLKAGVSGPLAAEYLFSKLKTVFSGRTMSSTAPMSDKMEHFRRTIEAMDIVVTQDLSAFKQLDAEATNDAERAEVAELRAGLLKMIEAWKKGVSP